MRKIIAIFALALGPRATLSLWQAFHGIYFVSYFETFKDFYVYYMWWVKNIGLGLLPYRDFASTYPPLFAYTLYGFSLIGLTSLPIIVSDAATGVLVFLVIKENTGKEKVATIAGVIYAFSPFFLIYEGYVWLSEQPMFFFVLLSLYLVQKDRVLLSSFFFALAVLFKQEALLLAPAFVIWLATKRGVLVSTKFVLTAVLTFAAASIPFLLLTPEQYLATLTMGRMFPVNSVLTLPGTVSTTQSMFCSSSTLSHFVSELCSSGTNTLNATISFLPLSSLIIGTFDDAMAVVLIIPIVFMRKERNSLQLSSGICFTLLLTVLFSLNYLSPYKYYFLPVYGLLLASSKDTPTAIVATLFPLLSFLLPPGLVQIGVPLWEVFAFLFVWFYQNRTHLQDSYLFAPKEAKQILKD